MKLSRIISTVIVIASGLLVLAGYLFGQNADGTLSPWGQIQMHILNTAVILAGFAVLVGIGNLLLVHTSKVRRKQKGAFYSFILIAALLVTFVFGFLAFSPLGPRLPIAGQVFSGIFNSIQLPVEASLMALLVVTLTYAGVRLLRRRLSLIPIIFLGTALLILMVATPWPFLGYLPFSDLIQRFFVQVLATAGARGILIGVALGTLTTSLRILMGVDRPYEGK